MTRRALTPDEVQVMQKQIERFSRELEYLTVQQQYHHWLLYQQGLKMNYEKQLRDKTLDLRQLEQDMRECHMQIEQCRQQIRDGVAVYPEHSKKRGVRKRREE